MDTLIVTISKDSIVSIKPLSQTSSVLVNNLLKNVHSCENIYPPSIHQNLSNISKNRCITQDLFFPLTRSTPPPPPFLPNNLTYLLSGIGQLSQISTGVTFKIYFSLKLVFSPFFFFFL